MPPLHAAALGNHLGILKHLIDKKYDYISDPNAKSEVSSNIRTVLCL